MKYVYFTSLDKNLKIIKTQEGKPKDYVMAHTSKLYSFIKVVCKDPYIFNFSKDYDNDSSLIITERIKGALQTYLNIPAYIYYLDMKNFEKSIVSWTDAVYSDYDEKPIKTECIPSVYEEILNLEKEGKIKIYRYPKRDKYTPSDDRDLVYHAIRRYYQGSSDVLDKLLALHPHLEKKLARELSFKKKNNPKHHSKDNTWTLEYNYLKYNSSKTEGTFHYKHSKDPKPWHVDIFSIMDEYAEVGLYYKYSVGDISHINADDISNLPHCHEWSSVLKAVYDYPETFFIPDDYLYLYSGQELDFLESIKHAALLNGLKDISKFYANTTINKDGTFNTVEDLEYNVEELKKRNYRNIIRDMVNKK